MTERVTAVGKHSGGNFDLESKQLMAGNVNLYDIKKRLGTNWTLKNVETMNQWMVISAFQIELIETMIDIDRKKIQTNAILGIVLSTLTGSLSATSIGVSDPSRVYATILYVVFSIFSFIIAIYTGYIKIYKIQERLENCLSAKQNWVKFSIEISSEMQLPLNLRRDGLYMIILHKDDYINLIKQELDIPERVRSAVAANKPEMPNQLTNVILNITQNTLSEVRSEEAETKRLERSNAATPLYEIGDFVCYKDKDYVIAAKIKVGGRFRYMLFCEDTPEYDILEDDIAYAKSPVIVNYEPRSEVQSRTLRDVRFTDAFITSRKQNTKDGKVVGVSYVIFVSYRNDTNQLIRDSYPDVIEPFLRKKQNLSKPVQKPSPTTMAPEPPE